MSKIGLAIKWLDLVPESNSLNIGFPLFVWWIHIEVAERVTRWVLIEIGIVKGSVHLGRVFMFDAIDTRPKHTFICSKNILWVGIPPCRAHFT